jgi:hypothetical protein
MFGSKGDVDKVSLATHTEALVKARMFEEENKRLHSQIDRLQEALVAATAAKAYESMQAAKYNIDTALTPTQIEKIKNQQAEGEFMSKYIEEQEKPLFNDAEEMMLLLGKNIGINVGDEPVHSGNSES